MSEKHFWQPDMGYWVAIDCAPKFAKIEREGEAPRLVEIRGEITAASYPAGTVEVPPRPTPGHTWDGQAWQAPPLPPEPEEVAQA